MKNLTPNQIRNRLARCVDSTHKRVALRDVRTAILIGGSDPIAADKLIDAALFHLTYAETITRRLKEIAQ